ncbi:MAG: response regulator [Alphaproteobacteria bacterium]|nr:response regulator [Alphaproteobacteria bacterium]MCD8519989.1 response regulator [Alphaproteobacteria bacterium]MCD8571450.1 response regulator [Alphaproteobacteria bacterium]
MKPFPESIIHADDDPDVRDVVRDMLGDMKGLKLSFCGDGEELLQAVRENMPDLILLDLSMPNLDGVAALEQLRKDPAFRGVLIIVLTGYRDLIMENKFKSLGIIGVIHKPFSPGMLPERIRYLWHLHHTGEDIKISSMM